MRQKQEEAETEMDKEGGKSHFGYKLHNIIDRDYELIRKFKTTTASVHDSYVN